MCLSLLCVPSVYLCSFSPCVLLLFLSALFVDVLCLLSVSSVSFVVFNVCVGVFFVYIDAWLCVSVCVCLCVRICVCPCLSQTVTTYLTANLPIKVMLVSTFFLPHRSLALTLGLWLQVCVCVRACLCLPVSVIKL